MTPEQYELKKTTILAVVICTIVFLLFLSYVANKTIPPREIVLSNGLYTVKCPGKLTIGKFVQPAILVCETGSVIEEIEYIK